MKINKILNLYSVKASSATINYIIDICGTNMQVIINEIRKLIEYAGKGGTITQSDVDLLCTKKIDSNIFQMIDKIGNKDIGGALEKLDEMLYQKEPIQKILITLYGNFKKIYIYQLSKAEGRNVAVDLNLQKEVSFQLGKLDKQSRYFSNDKIKKILYELINLDEKYKQGKIDPLIGLQSILCRYCGK